jgi:polysaccharide biosynthesis protein PslH
MKVLFISDGMSFINTGIASVSTRNYNLVVNTVGVQNVDLVIIGCKQLKDFKGAVKTYRAPTNKIHTLINCLNLYYPVLNRFIVDDIKKLIKKNSYDFIFVDNSMYGKFIKKVKREFKNIKFITFYHDIKYVLARQELKNSSPLHYPKYLATIYNERLSSIYSDKIITLSKRDSDKLYEIYKKQSVFELPVTIKDCFNMKMASKVEAKEVPTALFVGVGDYFPNVKGVEWFISNVLPNLNLKLIIIGRNMEMNRERLENMSNKVKVGGTVENIDDYYYKCSFIIAPLFEGAGMKVKVAEAFMFGKTVFGTKEAFEGYDIEKYNGSAFLCNNQDDFIRLIKKYIKDNSGIYFNEASRRLFLENFMDELHSDKLIGLFNC